MKSVSENLVKLLAERCALLSWRDLGEPQTDYSALTSGQAHLVVRCYLRSRLLWIHRLLFALHHAIIDAVFHVGALVLLPEQPFVIGLVLRKEQRHLALAG